MQENRKSEYASIPFWPGMASRYAASNFKSWYRKAIVLDELGNEATVHVPKVEISHLLKFVMVIDFQ